MPENGRVPFPDNSPNLLGALIISHNDIAADSAMNPSVFSIPVSVG